MQTVALLNARSLSTEDVSSTLSTLADLCVKSDLTPELIERTLPTLVRFLNEDDEEIVLEALRCIAGMAEGVRTSPASVCVSVLEKLPGTIQKLVDFLEDEDYTLGAAEALSE